jgi:hypothetical protein
MPSGVKKAGFEFASGGASDFRPALSGEVIDTVSSR